MQRACDLPTAPHVISVGAIETLGSAKESPMVRLHATSNTMK